MINCFAVCWNQLSSATSNWNDFLLQPASRCWEQQVIKRHLGQLFYDLARRKECRIEEGHLMPDHVHMLISIPPKYSVAQIIGYMKGKSSIWIAQNVERKMRNFLGHKFWARGYFVTTVGRDEEMIRAYIRNQELADQQLDQLELKISAASKSDQSS